ncbi:hypothetical protein ACFQ3B_01400 [Stackebrandtia endophytica]|uniref:hypothetical protein n=1 Tax=Stackebrandtia endophytica TaxID=1496996 RepID=UPI001154CE03|nr:hypothetical protein [Stackebrandtia endophytica]
MRPRIGREFVAWTPVSGGDETLCGDFPAALAPWTHAGEHCGPCETLGGGGPAYVLDDETAIKVADGTPEVLSHRKRPRDRVAP